MNNKSHTKAIGPVILAALIFFGATGWSLGNAQTNGASRHVSLTLSFEPPHMLVIHGSHLPGSDIRINYLEAYCRAGSTDADWLQHTVIPHRDELISRSDDWKSLRLRDTLTDGVVVEHTIIAKDDEVDFQLSAHNPGTKQSEAHWAQACVRLADFTGFDPGGMNLDDYLPKCFIFVGGRLTRLSQVQPWAKEARYTPGQVWPAPGVPRADVNPRPLSSVKTDNGLIGAFSKDEKLIFATAWEPYQELFQGVARCLHSDLRLGGLKPGEKKRVRGKIYVVTNDVPALMARYAGDFPEQMARPAPSRKTGRRASLRHVELFVEPNGFDSNVNNSSSLLNTLSPSRNEWTKQKL